MFLVKTFCFYCVILYVHGYNKNIHRADFDVSRPDIISWVADLQQKIFDMVDDFGYDVARPYIEQLVRDTEDKQKVLLKVEGKSKVRYEDVGRPAGRQSKDPQWLPDLKDFVKHAVATLGKDKLEDSLKPTIKFLELFHKVKIEDIDGEVFIKWSPKLN